VASTRYYVQPAIAWRPRRPDALQRAKQALQQISSRFASLGIYSYSRYYFGLRVRVRRIRRCGRICGSSTKTRYAPSGVGGSDGNIAQAAEILGVSRPTLYDLMASLCTKVAVPFQQSFYESNMTMRDSLRLAGAIATIFASLSLGCSDESPEMLLASAKTYLNKNDSKAAVIQLKNALQKNPDLAEGRFLLGASLLESGDPLAAEKELRKALELNYPRDSVIPVLARAMVVLGQFKKVLDEFGNVQLATPDATADVQTTIGDSLLALKQVEAARNAYAKALAARPDHIGARLGLAQSLARTGDLPQALAAVDSVLSTSAVHVDALQLRANILLAQGKRDDALTAFRKVVETRRDFVPAHWAAVELLLQQGKLAEGKKQLTDAIQLAPTHPRTLYLKALLAYREGNLPAARDAIQQQLRAAPDNLPGLLLSAAVEYDLRSPVQAEAQLLKVLQQSPEHSLARRMLVSGYVRNGQPGKALEVMKPVLAKISKDPTMLALAGQVYMSNGDPARAAEYFERASTLNPGDAANRTKLAISRVAAGDAQNGFRDLEQAAASDSGVGADMALIAGHMQRREYDKALAAIAALEKKQPKSAVPHNLRGGVLLAKGNKADARRSFERAVEVDPMYFPAAENLSKLDLADNKPEVARSRFDKILAKDAGNPQALLALARLRAASGGKPEEVAGLIGKAISAHPTDPAPRVALIGFYVGAKETKKAVVAAQEALAAVPDHADIIDAAGRAYQAAGETNQALSMYNKLASVQPGSALPFMRMAEVHVVAKNPDAALDSLRKALAIKPDLLQAQRAMIAVYVDTGRMEDALAVVRMVQKQRPKEAIGFILEGDVFSAKRNGTEAIAAYRAGLKKAASTDLAIKLHSALFAAGRRGEAEQFAIGWTKDHPNDEQYRLYLAESASARKDYRAAAEHYTKLLERQPNNPVLLNNVAWAAGQIKDPRALEYAERANKLLPDQPAVLDTLGVLLVEKGDSKRGLELLQRASRLAPSASDIRLDLAKALIKTGNKEAAKKELAELSKFDDKFSGQAEVARLMREL
jgi:putative PEP-CTERM system TPR-repeat lipoprotein